MPLQTLPSGRVAPPPVAGHRRPLSRSRYLAGLIWTLVRTDLKVYYHGSLAGFMWALLRPLSLFVAITFVFRMVFSSQPNFVLNLLIALFLYEFFSEGTKSGLTALWQKGYLLTKTRFPHWIVIPTATVNALVVLSVFTTATLVYLAVADRLPSWLHLMSFGSYLLALWLIILGIGLGTSALYLRFRDLNHLWDAIIQAGFFVAPIVFTLDMTPAALHRYLFLWPPTPVIVYSRQVLVEGTVPSLMQHLYLAAVTAIVLAAGIVIFRSLASTAAEQL